MPTAVIAAGIGVVGAVGGAAISSSASKKAGQVQTAAADRSAALSAQTAREGMALSSAQYQQTRSDLAPWRETGARALGQYAGYLGIPQAQQPQASAGLPSVAGGPRVSPMMSGQPRRFNGPQGRLSNGMDDGIINADSFGGDYIDGNYTGGNYGGNLPETNLPVNTGGGVPAPVGGDLNFTQALELNPQYKFLREEGMRGIERSAAARGSLQSGGTLKALSKYNQNLAYGMSSDYLNRLASVSGVGQTTATQTGQLGASAAANQANILSNSAANQGNAYAQGAAGAASGYLGSANAWSQGIQGVGDTIGGYLGYSQRNNPRPQIQPLETGRSLMGY